jgi:hypothetical protein
MDPEGSLSCSQEIWDKINPVHAIMSYLYGTDFNITFPPPKW